MTTKTSRKTAPPVPEPKPLEPQAPSAAEAQKAQAQPPIDRFDAGPVAISSNDDDPFVRRPNVERLPLTDFNLNDEGRPVGLHGPWVQIVQEPKIWARDPATNKLRPIANNPWQPTSPNEHGTFVFADEPRFPEHSVKLGPDGKPELDANGLQQWAPRSLHVGMTTAFEAANAGHHAMEQFLGRPVTFDDGLPLEIVPHALVGLEGHYNAKQNLIALGVVPYRLRDDPAVRMFEVASSAEYVGHETGHALLDAMKPNADRFSPGFGAWSESFADQAQMWASTQDPERVARLLRETRDLRLPNALSRIGESTGAINRDGQPLRDASADKHFSNTTDEVHNRSEILTGAAYQAFARIYDDLASQPGVSRNEAARRAGEIMGTLNARSADFTPEHDATLEDVGKAYLKVDEEFFGGAHHDLLVDELHKSGVFVVQSQWDFNAHEVSLPELTLQPATRESADAMVAKNLSALGIGPQFGLELAGHEVDRDGFQIVRVALTEGRGVGARPLQNHGVMVFRPDGTLADWHAPLPHWVRPQEAVKLLEQARESGIDAHGAPMHIVGRKNQTGSVEAVVEAPDGLSATVYSIEHPEGERREAPVDHLELGAAGLPEGAILLGPDDV